MGLHAAGDTPYVQAFPVEFDGQRLVGNVVMQELRERYGLHDDVAVIVRAYSSFYSRRAAKGLEARRRMHKDVQDYRRSGCTPYYVNHLYTRGEG